MAAFKLEQNGDVSIIKCPSNMDYSPELENSIKQWIETKGNIYIVDFAGVVEFKEKAYRPFVMLSQALKSSGRRLFGMNASPSLAKQLHQAGLSAVLPFVNNKAEAIAKVKPMGAKPLIDVEFINPFIAATQTVLATQCNTVSTGGKPYLKKPGEDLPMQIAGVINLNNPAFTGSIILCLRDEVFLKIYENMVGEKHAKITPELEDAAGELLNMIFGQAKTVLNDQKGYTLDRALPTVLSGERLSLRHQGHATAIILPFESAVGSFHIEVFVEKS